MSSKVKSSSAPAFAKGGSGHMYGKQSAGKQVPGQTASAGAGGGKFAQGGSTKMFGKQSATPAKPC
ncbi:hypothetical protein [Pseudolabrys sp.]|uniref:hypothetical protein n=1 Tax=Pseudolabrys sp. TaxID=1960880 RepID=UPI003D0E4009